MLEKTSFGGPDPSDNVSVSDIDKLDKPLIYYRQFKIRINF
jgi:hypothetical protein